MEISSIGSLPYQKTPSASGLQQAQGSGRRGRGMMKQMKEAMGAKKAGGSGSSGEFDELDTNKDGVVDEYELEAVGLSTMPEFQSTQAFLSLLAENNKAATLEHVV